MQNVRDVQNSSIFWDQNSDSPEVKHSLTHAKKDLTHAQGFDAWVPQKEKKRKKSHACNERKGGTTLSPFLSPCCFLTHKCLISNQGRCKSIIITWVQHIRYLQGCRPELITHCHGSAFLVLRWFVMIGATNLSKTPQKLGSHQSPIILILRRRTIHCETFEWQSLSDQ